MIRADLGGIYLAVISARRPDAVGPMTALVGPATWYVDAPSLAAYRGALAAPAQAKVAGDGSLCRARNAALEDAFSEPAHCVQLSDDLTKLALIGADGKAAPTPFPAVLARMQAARFETGAKLVGAAPTTNTFYFDPKRRIRTAAFIVGDLLLVSHTPLRFDEALCLKEDYDYTLQHLRRYGGIARCDDVLASFRHRSNKGGAVAYRTPAREAATIAQLTAKWGALIRPNPRRPGEILLNLKSTGAA